MALKDLIQAFATLRVCFKVKRGNKHPSNKTVCDCHGDITTSFFKYAKFQRFSTVCLTNLHANLWQIDFHSKLLPGIDVWIMRFFESSFQLVKLVSGKCGPITTMLLFAAVRILKKGQIGIKKNVLKF